MEKNAVYFILVMLLALYALNPSYEKHLVKLGEIPSRPMQEENSSSPGSKYRYKNYYLRSVVNNAARDERKTFGIFGFVFK
jgi:hypothetical protein